ncbi:DUF3426 domain-containing protein [Luteimonas gilva]|uniref:DUF3426 domain-containing protein n=1 Tax=Luteimonas gilva TaxID=2572684 RepID=A0A4U5JP92_9GAMM|nr:DUF3426 domain-containing protein [Luteimonas gilva]TKR30626.1 DUF3426 domain-containing protein [Luteimonas gilva]
MFVQCPRCRSLVAADAVGGAAPDFCPYCDSPLADAEVVQADAAPADAEASIEAEAETETAPIQAAIAEQDATEAEAMAASDDEPAEPAAIVAETADDAAREADRSEDGDDGFAEAPAASVASEKDGVAKKAPADPDKPKPRKKAAAPSFARRKQRAAERPTPPWLWAIAAGLALLAGLQIVLADRAQLAADARWRPAIASLCATLNCAIPPWREPAAFAMLGREVRQHPYMPGALRVDAAFRNNARWAQPWPDLVLTLSDVDGRALGTRIFAPKEYLGDKVTQKEIGSGQSAAIRMEIMEPAPGVVAFSFDFR